MAEEDALKSLKDRLQRSGMVVSEGSRKSRASRTPIDTTPETFMGASVVKSGDEEDPTITKSLEIPPASINLADEGDEMSGRKRRPRRALRQKTAAVDPETLSQMVNATAASTTQEEEEFKMAEPRDPTPPIPKEFALSPASKEDTPPPVEAAEAKHKSALSSGSPVGRSDEMAKLRMELESLQKKHGDMMEDLDDYNTLCERLVDNAEPSARTLAQYIAGMMEKEEQLEDLGRKHSMTLEELVKTKSELAAQQKVNEELKAAAPDDRKLEELQTACACKDEEITKLNAQLEEVAGKTAIAVGSVDASEEDEIIAMAQKELQMMEDLIKEQEEYVTNLEKELGISLTEEEEAIGEAESQTAEKTESVETEPTIAKEIPKDIVGPSDSAAPVK